MNGQRDTTLTVCLSRLSPTDHLSRTIAYVWFNQFDQAALEATGLISPTESPAPVHHLIARIRLSEFSSKGDRHALNLAKTSADESLRLAPQNASIIATTAFIDMVTGRGMSAIAGYSRALKLDPSNTFALEKRLQVLAGTGKLQEALYDADKLVRLGPSEPQYYRLRGSLRVQLGQHAAAVDDFDKVIAAERHDMLAYLNRAQALAALGRNKEAERDLSILIDGAPDGSRFPIADQQMAELLGQRSAIRLKSGQRRAGATDYIRAVQAGGIRPVLQLQLALKRRGYDIEINGKLDDRMIAATEKCLAANQCSPTKVRDI